MPEDLLADLTDEQCMAVSHMNGPMLVVAGAGSGKTRVVTRRIANLIRQGVKPWQILALTFTNKAAGEMRSRVEELTGGESPRWVGTFHSACARFLRFDLEKLNEGRDGRFSILDASDQEGLVKSILKEMRVVDKRFRPGMILSRISRAKCAFVAPGNYNEDGWDGEVIANVYAEYEKKLRKNNALDFDDLLLLTVRMLEGVPGLKESYRARYPFLLVDEYQDTNRVQYALLRLLSGPQANVHVTGDPDQAIYSWRGADYRNIMDFQSDFPGAKVVRLEQNYRSTKIILDVANALIKNNSHRLEKNLFTANEEGEPVTAARLQSDRQEGDWIANRVAGLRREGSSLRECAVFYRTNAQSRPLEEAFLREGIPYQIVGGVRFYERREVKDLLAHLKILINPRDTVSLRRIVDSRSSGVGEKTLMKIISAADADGLPVFSFLTARDSERKISANAKTAQFIKWCRELASVDIERADLAVREALAKSGLVEQLLLDGDDDSAESRVDNLHGLVARATEFVQRRTGLVAAGAGDSVGIDLAAFLEDVALVADVDNWDQEVDRATLMTLHSAKGLEFPYVFIAGVEEGLLPHKNSDKAEDREEERRLLYVGLTRARRRAFITLAAVRYNYGSADFSKPSRFLAELPENLLEELDYGDSTSPLTGGGFNPSSAPDWDDGIDLDFSDEISPEPPQRNKPAVIAAMPRRVVPHDDLRAGTLVRHATFGQGKVLAASGKEVVVQFFTGGTRKLLRELCQLERIS